jgi:hypothetical protein
MELNRQLGFQGLTEQGFQPVQENPCFTQLGEKGRYGSPESLSAQYLKGSLESPVIERLSEDGVFSPSLTF